MELEVKNAQRTGEEPPTKSHMERKTVVYADECKRVHNCTAANNPEALVLSLSKQNDSVVQRDVRDTHRSEQMRAHDTQTTNIITASYLTTNVIDTHTQSTRRWSPESTYREVWPSTRAPSTRVASRMTWKKTWIGSL
ncbi:hypothetical protein BDV93DRAFT_291831 [Ceratobasidium sp. AG-I]|nr:hypothetical protein BDV93DRAFT_291831 [Ceratobasidium sp. AG-I]